ncbi:MAG: hypothetical protein WBM50_20265 [Acidimicrobiales bacterium]
MTGPCMAAYGGRPTVGIRDRPSETKGTFAPDQDVAGSGMLIW